MKLKEDFITQNIDGTQFLVAMGGEEFSGIVHSNETVASYVVCRKEKTTMDAIVAAMAARYDAPGETIAADVAEIINTLRGIHALEE